MPSRAKTDEMDGRVDEDGAEHQVLRVRGVVAEEDDLSEKAGREKGVSGDRIEQEEPERARETADDTDIGALADDRVTAVRHESLPAWAEI